MDTTNSSQIPVFLAIIGHNADEGKQVMVNLNQIRTVDIEPDFLYLRFSETHCMRIPNGPAATEILGFLGTHTVMTNGVPLVEAELLRQKLLREEKDHAD